MEWKRQIHTAKKLWCNTILKVVTFTDVKIYKLENFESFPWSCLKIVWYKIRVNRAQTFYSHVVCSFVRNLPLQQVIFIASDWTFSLCVYVSFCRAFSLSILTSYFCCSVSNDLDAFACHTLIYSCLVLNFIK